MLPWRRRPSRDRELTRVRAGRSRPRPAGCQPRNTKDLSQDPADWRLTRSSANPPAVPLSCSCGKTGKPGSLPVTQVSACPETPRTPVVRGALPCCMDQGASRSEQGMYSPTGFVLGTLWFGCLRQFLLCRVPKTNAIAQSRQHGKLNGRTELVCFVAS